MSNNSNMHKAKAEKNDEFYTRLTDVEKELYHYRPHFKDKVVFLPCDDSWSAFWTFFHLQFNFLGLKKLVATHYDRDNISYKFVYDGENDNDIKVCKKIPLVGNGDFRNKECLDILDESDIVVTNPPFSLFREFVGTLVEHEKSFLIVGNSNAITYKEIFPLIRQNKMWLGVNMVKEFTQPDGTTKKFGNVQWFTNLDIKKRHEDLILWKTYNEHEFPKYDNYDAINVDKVANIPVDYDGVMGVPITFLNSYNPSQFEIVSFRKGDDGKDLVFTTERENSTVLSYPCTTSIAGMIKNSEGKINGKPTYARITIRRK